MKKITIVAFILLVTLGMSSQPNKTANKEQGISSKGYLAAPTIDSHDTYNYPQQAPSQTPAQPRHWYTPFERPDWWLVIVAAGTGIFIGWQAWETRKAAEASERAYKLSLGVTLPKLAVHALLAHTVDGNPVNYFQAPKISIEIKNYGTTPALLEFWCLCFSHEDLPEEPVYNGPATGMILEKQVVNSGEVFRLPHPTFIHRQSFTEEIAIAVANRDLPFHVYGFIAYRDIFGSPLKRLKFCETMLNVWGGENMCDWWERLSPPAYTGTEDFPFHSRIPFKVRIERAARWMKDLADDA